MLDKLLPITKGLNRRFAANGNNPFEIATRLKEVQDVMRSALQIALYYQIEAELETSIEESYQRMRSEGLID
jgi:hypothetical protein